MDWPLRFGIFLAPFHPVGQNPTLALERDLALIEHLDELGFDEAWIGEHHSAGYEIIASPEVFIASAAARTKHLRLGTGVSSLPYHQPLMLADRMVLLDHLTRGRVMFGVGPGALPSDAYMMGIEVARQRDMMEEAFEAIYALLHSDEPVTRDAGWFTLKDARLQLRPYSDPCFEIAVAAQVSPSGPRLAGRFGTSLLSLGATNTGGFDVLGSHWDVMEERSQEFGTTVDRRKWRLVGPMHIADTKEQAYEDVRHGLPQWVDYFQRVAALPLGVDATDPAADGRRPQRHRLRGDRHARRRRRADPASRRPVRRLRHVPDDGPRVGRPRADPPQLRAARPVRVPPLPGLRRGHRRQPRLGRREPPRLHRRGHRRGDRRHADPRRGEGRQAVDLIDG